MELHHGFGGISFWDNHEMPRHFRRIHSDLTRLGGPYAARREVADFLFDAPAGPALSRLPDIDFGPRVNAFRLEVREWLAENWKGWKISSEETRYNHIRADRAFSLTLAAKGWLTLHWPKEYGGQERSALDRLVLEEELAYVDAPIKWHDTAVNMLGLPCSGTAPRSSASSSWRSGVAKCPSRSATASRRTARTSRE